MVSLVQALGLHRSDRTPCGQPLAIAEAHALLELSRESGLSQSGLAQRLRLEKSSVSRVVSQLARRGWVKRKRDAADTRIVHVHLTGPGEAMVARLAAARSAMFSKIFAAIPQSKRARTLETLETLIEVIRET
jgi:DNA-binding MarR family transcriptional regulator